MQSAQRLLFRCSLCFHRLSKGQRFERPIQRCMSTVDASTSVTPASSSDQATVIPPPTLDGKSKEYPEKISRIVDSISKLTLLEASQLNELMKSTLNIPDAPVMAMGAMPTATTQAQESTAEEEPEDSQTSFTVNLVKFEADSKIKLIKEVKAQTEGMNLVQAKKFVESIPHEVKSGVNKDDANKLAAALEAAGGTVEIV